MIRFLNEQFSLETAPIANRRLLPQIQAILEALIPVPGSRICTVRKTTCELIEACPGGTSAEAFGNAIRLLERNCHLIKSIDQNDSGQSSSDEILFQLSHDAVAEPLRKWLAFEKHHSWRGRAKTELAELSEAWTSRSSRRYFPSVIKLVQMKLAVRRQPLNPAQSSFLSRATRFQLAKWTLIAVALCAVGLIAVKFNENIQLRNQQQQQFAQFLLCEPGQVPARLKDLENLNLDPATFDLPAQSLDARARLRSAAAQIWLGGENAQAVSDLVELVRSADATENPNVVSILKTKSNSQYVATALESSFRKSISIDDQLRYSLMAFELGDRSHLEEMLKSADADPTGETHLRHRFFEFSGMTPAELAKQLLAEDIDRNVKLLLLTILFKDDLQLELDKGLQSEILGEVLRMYQLDPDRKSHSIAKWILRKNALELPKIDSKPRRQWRQLEQGITLVNVAGGTVEYFNDQADDLAVPVREFLVSDTEVTLGQFLQFVEDEEFAGERPDMVLLSDLKFRELPEPKQWCFDPKSSPTDDYPVCRVSPLLAAMYCNWLSEKNSLEPVYKINERWFEVIPGAGGFRLPTEAEVQFMVRSGHRNSNFLGGEVDPSWVSGYASFLEDIPPQDRKLFNHLNFPTAKKLPNGLGLFDTVGSLAEISVNPLGEHLKIRTIGPSSYEPGVRAIELDFGNREINPYWANGKLGFRVVRNLN